MDSKQLIRALADRSGRSSKDTETLLNGFVSVIKNQCSAMNTISIPGFGSFEPRKRMERITVHPSTGKRILIPPKVVLTFKMSSVLKKQLREY
ncbi:MAG: HU family DNA-binding protein [Muribaculaceae bacterium]|nr:HU family DNA-binding protein [Muribaculaceae bacterium]